MRSVQLLFLFVGAAASAALFNPWYDQSSLSYDDTNSELSPRQRYFMDSWRRSQLKTPNRKIFCGADELGDDDWCTPCGRCAPGEFVSEKCTYKSDTVCKPCRGAYARIFWRECRFGNAMLVGDEDERDPNSIFADVETKIQGLEKMEKPSFDSSEQMEGDVDEILSSLDEETKNLRRKIEEGYFGSSEENSAAEKTISSSEEKHRIIDEVDEELRDAGLMESDEGEESSEETSESRDETAEEEGSEEINVEEIDERSGGSSEEEEERQESSEIVEGDSSEERSEGREEAVVYDFASFEESNDSGKEYTAEEVMRAMEEAENSSEEEQKASGGDSSEEEANQIGVLVEDNIYQVVAGEPVNLEPAMEADTGSSSSEEEAPAEKSAEESSEESEKTEEEVNGEEEEDDDDLVALKDGELISAAELRDLFALRTNMGMKTDAQFDKSYKLLVVKLQNSEGSRPRDAWEDEMDEQEAEEAAQMFALVRSQAPHILVAIILILTVYCLFLCFFIAPCWARRRRIAAALRAPMDEASRRMMETTYKRLQEEKDYEKMPIVAV